MKRTVLVVDDEADILAIVELSLGRLAGWDVTCVADVETAMTLVRERSFDAVVLDYQMPGLNGLDLARAIHSIDAKPALALLTATAGASVEVGDAPISALLSKPFDPMTLAHDIEEALGWTT